MPWDSSCTWNGGGESNVPPEGHFAAGYTNVSELRVSCTDVYVGEPRAEGPTGGGGGTSPNPPGGYDPCNTQTLTISYSRVNDGLKLAVLPPSPCDEDGDSGLPPLVDDDTFDENYPIYLPIDWELQYPQSWFNEEDQLDELTTLFVQQNAPPSSMIPEMYFKYGIKVDMINATPLNGRRTALAFPSNHRYFWKEVILQKPQMFSAFNRAEILAGRSLIVDDQWIKYNPTHNSYKYNPLRHHHEGQGRYAFAIPEKVHQKWTAILHQYKTTGKIPQLRPKINTLVGSLQIFTLLTDLETGNPDAWINWFGPHQDIGKIYKHQEKNVYFEITKQTTIKNSSGKIIRAKVTYDVFNDYIWDSDEKRFMGIVKLGTFTEYIDIDLKSTY